MDPTITPHDDDVEGHRLAANDNETVVDDEPLDDEDDAQG